MYRATVTYEELLGAICSQKDRQCLVHWYQQCVTVHHVPKCMSYHGAIGGLVITERAHCLSFWLLLTSFVLRLAWLVEHSLVHWYQQCVTVHHVPKCTNYHGAIGGLVITGRAHCLSFWLHTYITLISLLWDLSTLCEWVTFNQTCYAPSLTCWTFFGSLAPAMCNRISCAQVHELSWGHWRIGNNREGTLSVFLTIYIYIYINYI